MASSTTRFKLVVVLVTTTCIFSVHTQFQKHSYNGHTQSYGYYSYPQDAVGAYQEQARSQVGTESSSSSSSTSSWWPNSLSNWAWNALVKWSVGVVDSFPGNNPKFDKNLLKRLANFSTGNSFLNSNRTHGEGRLFNSFGDDNLELYSLLGVLSFAGVLGVVIIYFARLNRTKGRRRRSILHNLDGNYFDDDDDDGFYVSNGLNFSQLMEHLYDEYITGNSSKHYNSYNNDANTFHTLDMDNNGTNHSVQTDIHTDDNTNSDTNRNQSNSTSNNMTEIDDMTFKTYTLHLINPTNASKL